MNFIKKLFTKPTPTHYTPQVLTEQQLSLIDFLDRDLLNEHPHTSAEYLKMHIRSCEIGLQFQHLHFVQLCAMIKKQVKLGTMYIPNSVSFLVEPDGTWVFVYAVRDDIGSSPVCAKMFIECLMRTNNARFNKDKQ